MKKTIKFIVMATLCLIFNSRAQSQPSEGPAAKVGDTIPESLWNMPLQVINHPEGRKTITLSEFRNKKLIIIDFWGSYCSPCIASIDKLIPISKKYADDMALVAVTAHDVSTQAALKTMKRKKWTIPSVFDVDKFLYSKALPNGYGNGIPYIIWIQNNRITAIPQLAYNTEENIIKAIRGEKVEMQMKSTNLKLLDYSSPLFRAGNGKTGLYYKNSYAVISRYLPGYGSGSPIRYLQKGDTTILAAVNRPLKNLLFDAWQQNIFTGLDADNGILWEISDSLKYRLLNPPKYDKKHNLVNDLALASWRSKNTYGYNLRYPKAISNKQALHLMQQDITRFFGAYLRLSFSMSTAAHSYAVLTPTGTTAQAIKLLQNKDNKKYQNLSFRQSFMAKITNAVPGLSIRQVIDSTGIDHSTRVSFDFPDNLKNDPVQLSAALLKYGLELHIRQANVPVLLVKEKARSAKSNTLKN